MKTPVASALMLLAAVHHLVQASNHESRVNPISKVLDLLTNLEAKITAERDASKKEYQETMITCTGKSEQLSLSIKTSTAEVTELKATIEKAEANLVSLDTKVQEYIDSLAADSDNLEKAKAVRATDKEDYEAKVKELSETIETLQGALAILTNEKHTGSLMQVKSGNNVLQALTAMVQAHKLSSADGAKLTAYVQQQAQSDDSDEDIRGVAPARSGGIVSALQDLLYSAQVELRKAQKAEEDAVLNFQRLEASLTREIKTAEDDMADTKTDITDAQHSKATAEGDLSKTSADLAQDTKQLAMLKTDCATTAKNFEAELASSAEELKALTTSKKVVQESTGGAEKATYGLNQISFLQVQKVRLKSSADLANVEIVHFLRDLAMKRNAPALAQLSLRIQSLVLNGEPFAKVKVLIMDMIDKLSKEAATEASQKEYCDEETGKNEIAIDEFTFDLEKLSTKIKLGKATSSKLKQEVATLQKEIADIAKDQAEMNAERTETHSTFVKEKADLEAGAEAVKTALSILRTYYSKADKSNADGIIGLLEVAASDFTKGAAVRIASEYHAQQAYKELTEENKVSTAIKQTEAEYKTKEAAELDTDLARLSSDQIATQQSLAAKLEYKSKLSQMCTKTESFAERKANREAEIAGLQEALAYLEGQGSLLQVHASPRALRR